MPLIGADPALLIQDMGGARPVSINGHRPVINWSAQHHPAHIAM